MIDLYLFQPTVEIDITGPTNFEIHTTLNPFTVTAGNVQVVSLTSAADTTKGPTFNLVVESGSHQMNMSGSLTVLGMTVSSWEFYVSYDERVLNITQPTGPFSTLKLNGAITSAQDMNLGGSITVGINQTLDLGALGTYPLKCSVSGSLKLAAGDFAEAEHQGVVLWVTGSATYTLWSYSGTVSTGNLSIDPSALGNMDTALAKAIASDVGGQLQKDAVAWLKLVKAGTLTLPDSSAKAIGNILKNTFKIGWKDAAKDMKDAGYGKDVIKTLLSDAYGEAGTIVDDLLSALHIT